MSAPKVAAAHTPGPKCEGPDDSGYVKIEQHTKGWPGSGFNAAHEELKARFAPKADPGSEVQISFTITHFKGDHNRMFTHWGSIAIGPEAGVKLAETIAPSLAALRASHAALVAALERNSLALTRANADLLVLPLPNGADSGFAADRVKTVCTELRTADSLTRAALAAARKVQP